MNPRRAIVKEIIQDRTATLTPAERQLADILLRDYPIAGLQSVTKFAGAAGVSTPTAIRMARKLGFDGFPEFQAALREEASAQMKTPTRKREDWLGASSSPLLREFAQAVFDNLERTMQRLDDATFDAVAQVLSDPARPVFLSGGRITRSNADSLFNHLQIMRPNVTLLGQSPNVWPQYLLDMDASAVLVLFDIRRYEADLARLARLAHDRGATIVLFTDQWGSPVSSIARHVFNAMVEVPSSWDSTISINLIIEALIAEVQSRRWDATRERIEALEEMFRSTRIFRKSP